MRLQLLLLLVSLSAASTLVCSRNGINRDTVKSRIISAVGDPVTPELVDAFIARARGLCLPSGFKLDGAELVKRFDRDLDGVLTETDWAAATDYQVQYACRVLMCYEDHVPGGRK